jgi:hypothetical protein
VYTESTRPLSEDERSRLKRRLRPTADEIAWVFFPLIGLSGVGFCFGRLLGWVLSWFGVQTGPWLLTSPLCIGLVVGLAGSIWMLRGLARANDELRGELGADTASVIHVDNASAVTVGDPDDEAPMVVFDVGDGKLLCLLGQWMWDPHLFEPPGAHDQFPCDSFSVATLPESGTVLSVRVRGRPLGKLRRMTLKATGLTKYGISDSRDCVLLDGTL